MQKAKKQPGHLLPLPFVDMGGEKLLQFIWQFGYFNKASLTTTEGEELTVLFPGTLNNNGGPDFTAAKIRFGQTTFFGNVELHLKTSDWEKHQHNNDVQYQNVILHVVFQHDKTLPHAIPVLELEPRISTLLLQRYNSLMNVQNFIPCSTSVASVSALLWTSWKERLLVERLTRKSANILMMLEKSKAHWEETFWWMLARNFGMKVNGDAFEAIARSIAVTTLAKHKASLPQIEALLLGQAGLLEENFIEQYPLLLQREYRYLQKKLQLMPISIPLQFMRMRPSNFPTIRLAQLAALVQQSSHLFSTIKEASGLEEVKCLFSVKANDFWHNHYTLQQASSFRHKTLGSDMTDNIIINTIVPVLFAYGLYHNEERYKEKALRWLEEVSAEKNAITKGFAEINIKAQTAQDSQALIEMKNEYCSARKCLSCAVGNSLLKRELQGGSSVSEASKKM